MSDKDLYFDTRNRSEMPFQIFIGGRGTGKTYSSLRNEVLDENLKKYTAGSRGKFIYMRRMAKEIELCASKISNPFKRVNKDYNLHIEAYMKDKDGYAVFYDGDIDEKSSAAEPIGYGIGLSTFSGLRGVDFSDVTTIIFDEFIPERQTRKVKAEGKIFLNMYETINRNRELQGEPPVKVLLLANAISMNSEILLAMGAVPTMASMIVKHQKRATLRERALYIEMIEQRELAQLKQKTALYKLTADNDFTKEAIMNQFTNDNLGFAKKVAINEYKSMFNFCDYTFYKHKSREEYYFAKRKDSAPITYDSSQIDIMKKSYNYWYRNLILSRRVFFDDYSTKLVFDTIFNN